MPFRALTLTKSFLLFFVVLFLAACKPSASSQTVTVLAEETTQITLTATNSPTSWNIVAGPLHGILEGDPPSLSYTSSPGYLGVDSFSFTATNGDGTSGVATVSINVVSEIVDEITIDLFQADVSEINFGDSATLEWAVSNAEAVVIEPNIGSVSSSGSIVVSPSVTTTYQLTASAGDQTVLSDVVVVVLPEDDLPPNPSDVAQPLNPQQVGFADDVAFLFEGANPIQVGLDPASLQEKLVSVVKGKILDRNNQPLSGVQVSFKDHEEFGSTLTRADGEYDLVVNGGYSYTVNYSAPNRFPVQRSIAVPASNYIWAEDIVMIEKDPLSTEVQLGSDTAQFAKGSVSNDMDGQRQAVLFFPRSTQASIVSDNGTSTLDKITVRATEYTVGENGAEAMPGELPATSGYTYAVEFSVDEAPIGPSVHVVFNQPIPVYVDNFLNFPTGTVVPSGWYDYDTRSWKPSKNGRIIEIIAIANSQAVVSVNSSGQAANESELSNLGISIDELSTLAQIYPVGKSIWRVPVDHFSPYDFNFPIVKGSNVKVPGENGSSVGPKPDDTPMDCDCTKTGSIIEASNQVLGERVPVEGSTLTLNYRSNRVPGYTSGRKLNIKLTDDSLIDATRVHLKILIAGRKFEWDYPYSANLYHEFLWDGLDGYGRDTSGKPYAATISIGYEYDTDYYGTIDDYAAQFGVPVAQIPEINSIGASRQTTTFWNEWVVQLNHMDVKEVMGLNGWTLSNHHFYSRANATLYLGDGTTSKSVAMSRTLQTVAGTRSTYNMSYADGENALDTFIIAGPMGVSPTGEVFYSVSSPYKLIRKIGLDGKVYTVAGSLDPGAPIEDVDTEGQLATDIRIKGTPTINHIDRSGYLYYADNLVGNVRIRKISPSGTVTTVAGGGTLLVPGNNTDARDMKFSSIWVIGVGSDGTVYYSDGYNKRVYTIASDGVVRPYLGTGYFGTSFVENMPALSMPLPEFGGGIALSPNDEIHIASQNRIMRVTPAGEVVTVAGNGFSDADNDGDGVPALTSTLSNIAGIYFSSDGTMFVTTSNKTSLPGSRIWQIDNQGIQKVVAGASRVGVSSFAEGSSVFDINLNFNSMTVSQDGDIYVNRRWWEGCAISYCSGIHKLTKNPVANANAFFTIPSLDGAELFYFDENGRHIETRGSLLGNIKYSFSYAGGYLEKIADKFGNELSIERSGVTATAIRAPYNHRTELIPYSDGYLHRVEYSDGKYFQFGYSSDGLLDTFTDLNGNSTAIKYYTDGKLEKDASPSGGSWNLARLNTSDGYKVELTSRLGRKTSYTVAGMGDGSHTYTMTGPGGEAYTHAGQKDGTTIVENPNGSVLTIEKKSDPALGVYGGLSPKTSNLKVSFPSGKELTIEHIRRATLTNEMDPGTLTTLEDITTINGREFKTEFNKNTNTATFTSAEGRVATTKFDSNGQISEILRAGVHPIHLKYNTNGRLEEVYQGFGANLRSTSVSYRTLDGFIDRVTKPDLGWVEYDSFDVLGAPKKIESSAGASVSLNYDNMGYITHVSPPGRQAHEFKYNEIGFREDYIPPAIVGVESSIHYDFDLDSDLDLVTFKSGPTIDYTFNPVTGRLENVSFEGESYQFKTYTSGQIKSIDNGDSKLDYVFDGALLKKETWSGVVQGVVEREYDNNLQLEYQILNGSSIGFLYDDDGLLRRAGALDIVPDSNNGLTRSTKIGNISTQHDYSLFGEIESYVSSHLSNTLFSQYVASRDLLGRIKDVHVDVEGVSTSIHYDYDSANRLWKVFHNNSLIKEYHYDSNGNRTHVNGVLVATFDEQDRLTSNNNNLYVYNDTGTLKLRTDTLSGAQDRYFYDVFSNLRRVELSSGSTIDYIIDGQNRRIGKKVNGSLVQGFIYDNKLNVVAELDSSNTVVSRFVYGSRGNVPDYLIKSGNTYRIISDVLGSVRLVVDIQTGVVAQRIDYDEFGVVLSNTNPGFQPFGFAGGVFDTDTGLIRFGVRDYDPSIGRWTAKDPSLFAGGDSNLYAYVGNDPINWIDPTGFCAQSGNSPDMPDEPGLVNLIDEATKFFTEDGLESAVELYQGNFGAAAAAAVLFAAKPIKPLKYGPNDPPVRIEGDWSLNDLKAALLGHPPKGLGKPDLHHADQMPGSGIHEVIPSEHRGNMDLHPNRFNQGVTPEMRKEDRELHWWYRAREMGADSLLPDWIYD